MCIGWCLKSRQFYVGLLVGALIVLGLYDPSVLRPWGTVKEPIKPLPPAPGTRVVDPLAKTWNLNTDRVQWGPIIPLAQISASAYGHGEQFETTLHEWGFTTFEPIEDGSSFGFVASNDSTVVVVFRGTDDVIDWLTNVDAVPVPVDHGAVHRGFRNVTSKLMPRTLDAARTQGAAEKKLWVTGHSLGGAMALLFAHECEEQGLKLAGLVTFGQPMLCNGTFARYVNSQLAGKYLRFVHGGDAVTRMAPLYSHCGNLVWFTEGTYIFERPAFPMMATGRSDTAEEPIRYQAGPQPLTVEEFGALKKRKTERRRIIRRRRPDENVDSFGAPAAYEDHSMAGYIHWVASLAAKDNVAATPPGQAVGARGW
jgi:pimeloyl-ACP methyl ester carboxylesterase